jgi:hypothetical protein
MFGSNVPDVYESIAFAASGDGVIAGSVWGSRCPLSMDDKIAGVQVGGVDVFQKQGVMAIERD